MTESYAVVNLCTIIRLLLMLFNMRSLWCIVDIPILNATLPTSIRILDTLTRILHLQTIDNPLLSTTCLGAEIETVNIAAEETRVHVEGLLDKTARQRATMSSRRV